MVAPGRASMPQDETVGDGVLERTLSMTAAARAAVVAARAAVVAAAASMEATTAAACLVSMKKEAIRPTSVGRTLAQAALNTRISRMDPTSFPWYGCPSGYTKNITHEMLPQCLKEGAFGRRVESLVIPGPLGSKRYRFVHPTRHSLWQVQVSQTGPNKNWLGHVSDPRVGATLAAAALEDERLLVPYCDGAKKWLHWVVSDPGAARGWASALRLSAHPSSASEKRGRPTLHTSPADTAYAKRAR